MCGIAGLIAFHSKQDSSERVHLMNQAQKHRGPDGAGIYTKDGVTLGHTRLAIIDLEGGHQPFVNDSKTMALTFNGEIYNYIEIASELGEPGIKSDTEVLLRAFERWGIASVDRFRGMFSFVVHDLRENTVYVVRDRMGIKPLYYHHNSEHFAFASELGALMASKVVPAEIDPVSVGEYFRYQYVPVPRTIYKNVHKLEPGHFLKIDLNTGFMTKKQYWELNPKVQNRSEEDWRQELDQELHDTVKLYCRSDVPFGAFLSGGVDSSLVTAMMSKQLPTPVRTFSIGFKESAYSELPYAQQASDICKTVHFERVVSADLTQDIMGKLANHFGEPFADSSAIPTYYVSRETAGQVKMVLSGDGGDEVFAGYEVYGLLLRQTQRPAYNLLRPFFKAAHQVVPWRFPFRRLSRACMVRSVGIGEHYDLYRHIFSDEAIEKMLLQRQKQLPLSNGSLPISKMDPVSHFMAMDTRTYMLDDILTKVDRMSMANSLEVRVPLLDHKIVELAFNMPLSYKVSVDEDGQIKGKKILKDVASQYYPDHFLNRQKMGFGIPITEWCKGPLWPQIQRHFENRSNAVYQWLDYDVVQDLLMTFVGSGGTSASSIWCLLMFEIWLNQVHPTHQHAV